MRKIPNNSSEQEILKFVEEWVTLLAQGKYKEAYEFTAQDPYYQWTPESIEKIIAGYGLYELMPNGVIYRVTDPKTCSGKAGYRMIDGYMKRQKGEMVREVWYSLPLNGFWSDLTATFRIINDGSDIYLELNDIHVF